MSTVMNSIKNDNDNDNEWKVQAKPKMNKSKTSPGACRFGTTNTATHKTTTLCDTTKSNVVANPIHLSPTKVHFVNGKAKKIIDDCFSKGVDIRDIFKQFNYVKNDSPLKTSITVYIFIQSALFDKLKWHSFLAAHVFCLPSHQENFGIAVAEALSSKKPVIITNKVNIFKTIKNNSAGIVTKNNLISFSLGLKKFLQLNKYEYQKYSVNSFRCFLENFQIKPVAKNLSKYIKKHLNKYDNNKK